MAHCGVTSLVPFLRFDSRNFCALLPDRFSRMKTCVQRAEGTVLRAEEARGQVGLVEGEDCEREEDVHHLAALMLHEFAELHVGYVVACAGKESQSRRRRARALLLRRERGDAPV